MRPVLHPPRQPKGKDWLYCRLCDTDLLRSHKFEHEQEEPHRSLQGAFQREELLDSVIPYSCPGRIRFFYPGAARLDNLLYDAGRAAAQGRRMDRGVSPAARYGPVAQR
jgi:hypothetical protein